MRYAILSFPTTHSDIMASRSFVRAARNSAGGGLGVTTSCGRVQRGAASRRRSLGRQERSHDHRQCEIHMPRHRKCRVVPSIIRIFVRTRARRSEVVTTLAARPPALPLSSRRAALLLRLYVGPREREVMEVGCRNHHDQHTDVE